MALMAAVKAIMAWRNVMAKCQNESLKLMKSKCNGNEQRNVNVNGMKAKYQS